MIILLNELNIIDIPFVFSFFSPKSILLPIYFIDGVITVNDFIEFVCIFAFYPLESILPSIIYIVTFKLIVLLSICGVNSNRTITDV